MSKRKDTRGKKGRRTSASRPTRASATGAVGARAKGRWRNIAIGVVVVLALAAIAALVFRGLGSEAGRDIEVVYHGIQGGFTEEGFPYLGSPDAAVVVMEFSDFQCSHCAAYNLRSEEALLEDYVATGEVRYVVHYYSSSNPASLQAAEAAMCAADQGLYFQFQRALFENPATLREDFIARARDTGLNVRDFAACWDSERHRSALLDHIQEAKALGITGTPSFMINDRLVVGNRPNDIRRVIEEELAEAGQ